MSWNENLAWSPNKIAHMGFVAGPEAEKWERAKDDEEALPAKKKPAANQSTVKAKQKLKGCKPSQTTKPTKKTNKAKGMKTAAKKPMKSKS